MNLIYRFVCFVQSAKEGYQDVKDNIMTTCTYQSGYEESKISKTSKSCPISYSYSSLQMKASEVKSTIFGMVGPRWKMSIPTIPLQSIKKPIAANANLHAVHHHLTHLKVKNEPLLL